MKRENEMLETYKSLQANKEKRASLFESAINKQNENKNDFSKRYYEILESRHEREREHSKLMEAARNEAFASALKAIYITALEANTLTDEGIILAENMVDNYIKENNGARNIFNNVKHETYLLAKIRSIVEDAAKKETEDIEKIDKEDIDNTEIQFKDDEVEETEADKEVEDDIGADEVTPDMKKPAEEESTEEDPEAIKAKLEELGYEVKKDEEAESVEEDPEAIKSKLEELGYEVKKDEEPPVDSAVDEPAAPEGEVNAADNVSSEEPVEENPEDAPIDDDEDLESEEDEDLDIDGDGEDDFGVDEPEDTVNIDPKHKMFKELENEKEVKDAIELIRSRVSDAEEAFIKRNAEDKEKINKLLNKISDNINTVEKIADNDSDESKIAQENALMYKKQINEITNNRPLTIFEKMTRNLTNNIITNESAKVQYLNEDGSMDMNSIVESAKVMYAFLETLNTLQLESVDGKYIQNILTSMN